MRNWFHPTDAADIRRRLENLKPDSRPAWGQLTAGALLCHLADPIKVALGEKKARRLQTPVGLPGIAQAVVWMLPWPKGAPTAPEFLPGKGMTAPGDFEEDKRMLLEVMHRFSDAPDDVKFSPNPLFGRLSRRGWGRLMWRHFDHHLRQFGL